MIANLEAPKNKFLVHIWRMVDEDGNATGDEVYQVFDSLLSAIGYVEIYPEYNVSVRAVSPHDFVLGSRYVADIHFEGMGWSDHIGSIIEIEEYSYE